MLDKASLVALETFGFSIAGFGVSFGVGALFFTFSFFGITTLSSVAVSCDKMASSGVVGVGNFGLVFYVQNLALVIGTLSHFAIAKVDRKPTTATASKCCKRIGVVGRPKTDKK